MTIPFFGLFDAWTLTGLRIAYGLIFFLHGWAKIRNLKQTQEGFTSMGFRPGIMWGTLVAFVEFFGGIAVILGIFTQLAALFLVAVMTVATFWKIKNKKHLVGGYELDLILLTSGLVLFSLGGGIYSLENYFNWQLLF